jgi:hypothetical protein
VSDSEKRDENGGGRDPSTGRFVAGNGGGGRKAISHEVRAMLEAKTPDAAQRLIDALDADRPVVVGNGPHATVEMVPDHDTRMKAAEAILNRLYGKPTVAVTGEDGGPLRIGADATTLEMLRKLARP